jgi:hypothetical protein
VPALEGHEQAAIGQPCERLGVARPAGGERPAVAVADRQQRRIGEAGEQAVAVAEDARAQPVRLVGDGEQGAVRFDQQAREAAEGTVRRGERERATEEERPEPVEPRLLLRQRQPAGGDGERPRFRRERRERRGEQRAAGEPQATSAACSAAARCQASAASSSNSSASFFIIVPPSSSASTIVTARR